MGLIREVLLIDNNLKEKKMSDIFRKALDQLAENLKGATGLRIKKDEDLDVLHQQALDVLSDERHKQDWSRVEQVVRENIAEKERRVKIRLIKKEMLERVLCASEEKKND